jgi:integrase
LPRDANGKRRQRRYTFRGTKGDAENERSRIVHEVTSGAFVDSKKITVGEYLDWWLESCIKPRVAPRTFEGYEMIVKRHLKPALGRIRLTKLSPLHVQEYEARALLEGRVGSKAALSKQTVLHHHRVLHAALEFAVKTGVTIRNPLDAVEPPRPERRSMTTLDAAEVGKLLAAAVGTRLHAPLQLAVATGMRRGELLGLHWRDIDFATGKLAVRWSL